MNYLEALNCGNKILRKSNILSYSIDSELLLAKVLNLTREKLLINLKNEITKKKYLSYRKLIYRRKKNEPIAYILKKKEFWKNEFFVNKDVLIPRPETELIVEETLKKIDLKSSKNLLDIGVGSGCILISILKERPNCFGTALDISKKALKVANINAKMHQTENKIKFINIDIDKFNFKKYDFIISNPPYIDNIKLKRLEENVRLFEPKVALKAGFDGLTEIKKLIIKSKNLLKINGILIFEIGVKQEKYIKEFLINNCFYINKILKDVKSIPRVIISTKV